MKSSLQMFAIVSVLIFGCAGSQSIFAQAAPPSAPAPNTTPLTPEDKAKLMKARQQVLASNPDLKAEADDLKKQGQALKGGDATMEDKMAFMQSVEAHQEKMKTAMLKVDPTLGPIIDQAEAEMKQKMQARAAKSGN